MGAQPIHRILGDELPERIAAYYDAVDAERPDEAVRQMAPDALVALPPRGGQEVDPRNVLRGRPAVTKWLELRANSPFLHDPLLCVTDGSCCLLEGTMRRRDSGQAAITYVASFRVGAAGIERHVAFATESVAPPPRRGGLGTGDARSLVEAYFGALARGQFEEAAGYFSADVMYSHPPYRHTGIQSNRRVIFNSREELLAAFKERGKTTYRHRILDFIQRGSYALFELEVVDLPGGGTGGSICSVGLDGEGRINRYIANYTEPAVPQS